MRYYVMFWHPREGCAKLAELESGGKRLGSNMRLLFLFAMLHILYACQSPARFQAAQDRPLIAIDAY